MKDLWTFDTKEKLDSFAAILEKHGIAYETETRKKSSSEFHLSVGEGDFVVAKRLLLKHRKRRTSADLS